MPPWSTSSFDGCGPRAGTPRGSLVLGQGRTWIDRRARVSPDGRAAACRRGEVGGSGSAGDARDGRPQDAPGERDRTRAGMAAGARGRLLVLREDWTARRRVAAHEATFAGAFPARGWAVRRWLRDPGVGADAAVAPGRPTPADPPTSRGDLAAFSGLIYLTDAPRRALVIASRFTRRGAARRTRQVATWSTPDDIVMTNARVVDAWQKPAERSAQPRTVRAAETPAARRRTRPRSRQAGSGGAAPRLP